MYRIYKMEYNYEIEKKKFVDGWIEFNKGVSNKFKMEGILYGFELYWEKLLSRKLNEKTENTKE